MDKQLAVSMIEAELKAGTITRDDLLRLVGETPAPTPAPVQPAVVTPAPVTPAAVEQTSKNMVNVLYAIGGIIVLAGIGVLVSQNWNEIGLAGRILVTLGISFATYVAGLLFRKEEQSILAQVMFLLAAMLAPLGVVVLLNQTGATFTYNLQAFVGLGLALIFGFALATTRRAILIPLTAAFATWAYYAVVLHLFGFDYFGDSLKWAAMVQGVAWILFGVWAHTFQLNSNNKEKEAAAIKNMLFGVGTLAFLGGGSSIGGGFDLIFILFIFAAFYGSLYFKCRSMLTLAAFFLIGHIFKLTALYFINSIGWPVALICAGFLVIGVGYATYYLNKYYIANK